MAWRSPHRFLDGDNSTSQNTRVFYDASGNAHIFFYDGHGTDGIIHSYRLAGGDENDWVHPLHEPLMTQGKAPKMMVDSQGTFHVVGMDWGATRCKHGYANLVSLAAASPTFTSHNVSNIPQENASDRIPGICEDENTAGTMYVAFADDNGGGGVSICKSTDYGVNWSDIYNWDLDEGGNFLNWVPAIEIAVLSTGELIIAVLADSDVGGGSNGTFMVYKFDPAAPATPVKLLTGTSYLVGTGEGGLNSYLRHYLSIDANDNITIHYGYNWKIYKLTSESADSHTIWINTLVWEGSNGELAKYFNMYTASNGISHYAFINWGTTKKGLMYFNDRYFQVQQLYPALVEDPDAYWDLKAPAITANSSGEVLVGYTNNTDTQSLNCVENLNAQRQRAPWNLPEEVTSSSGTAGRPSMLIDDDGFAHIFQYHDNGPGWEGRYYTNSSGSWVYSIFDDGSGYSSTDTGGRICRPPAYVGGVFYLTYYDFTGQDIRFCKGTPGSWTLNKVADAGNQYSSMLVDIDDSDIIHVVYSEVADNLTYIKSIDGGANWGTPEVIYDGAGALPKYLSMVQTADGLLHVVCCDDYGGDDVFYIGGSAGSWYGTQVSGNWNDWEIQILKSPVDESLHVIGWWSSDVQHVELSFGTPSTPSTVSFGTVVDRTHHAIYCRDFHSVIDNDGVIHVAIYADNDFGTDWDLYYTNSLMWNKLENNNEYGTIEGPVDAYASTGRYAFIALDTFGNIHIASYEGVSDTIRYINNVPEEGVGESVSLGDDFVAEIDNMPFTDGAKFGIGFSYTLGIESDIELTYGLRVGADLASPYDIYQIAYSDTELVTGITVSSDTTFYQNIGYTYSDLTVVSDLAEDVYTVLDCSYDISTGLEANISFSQAIRVESDTEMPFNLSERLRVDLDAPYKIEKLTSSTLNVPYGIFTVAHSDTEFSLEILDHNKVYSDTMILHMIRNETSEKMTSTFSAEVSE